MDLSDVIVFETVCVPCSDLMLFAFGLVVVQRNPSGWIPLIDGTTYNDNSSIYTV